MSSGLWELNLDDIDDYNCFYKTFIFIISFIFAVAPHMQCKRYDYPCCKDEELEVPELINDLSEVTKQVMGPASWADSLNFLSSTQKFTRKKSGKNNLLKCWAGIGFVLTLHCMFGISYK